MIDVQGLTARSPRAARANLGPLSFSLEAGRSYALVAERAVTVELLLSVLAGSTAPSKGSVTIAGSPPSANAKVAYVPHTPDLPEVLLVSDFLALAARLRGEAPVAAEERLAIFGVGPLARRRIDTLTFEESRTVALVEALTSKAELLLLADPLVDLDPRAMPKVADALARRSKDGATVVVATASREDARHLCREWLWFENGKLTLRTADEAEWAPLPDAKNARLFVRSEGARYLLAELASDPNFQTVHADGAELVVTGRDPVVMATAVAAAARRANAELDFMAFETGPREP